MKEKNDIEKLDEQIRFLKDNVENRPEVIRDGDREIIIEKLSSGTKKINKIDELKDFENSNDKVPCQETESTKEMKNLNETDDSFYAKNTSFKALNFSIILASVLFLIVLFLIIFLL